MKFNAQVDYDREEDVLYLYNEDEKVKGSLETEISKGIGIVLDLNNRKQVVGIEIFNASEFLELSKGEIEEIKSARVSTYQEGNIFGGMFYLKLPKEVRSMIVPTKVPAKA